MGRLRFTAFLPATVLLFAAFTCRIHAQQVSGLRVTAVQFEVEERIYRDRYVFLRSVEDLVREAVQEFDPDIVVFPEYTSVFLALSPYSQLLDLVATFEEGLKLLSELDPGIRRPKDVFGREADRTAREMDRLWGGLAREYGIYIVAGTYFHKEVTDSGEEALYNRMAVFGPKGSRVYEQDKVYLTPFEETALGLSPGRIDGRDGIVVEGERIVFSICRSTFFEDWDRKYGDATVWIDLKANGVSYTRQQSSRFQNAIPVRLFKSGVPYGITVCLTGSFLDLFWEGKSSLSLLAGQSAVTAWSTGSPRKEELMHLPIPAPARRQYSGKLQTLRSPPPAAD